MYTSAYNAKLVSRNLQIYILVHMSVSFVLCVQKLLLLFRNRTVVGLCVCVCRCVIGRLNVTTSSIVVLNQYSMLLTIVNMFITRSIIVYCWANQSQWSPNCYIFTYLCTQLTSKHRVSSSHLKCIINHIESRILTDTLDYVFL